MERIAQLVLIAMGEVGIDTSKFKAHAVRGSATTDLLKANVPSIAVQARGGWQTESAYIHNYARLHQSIDVDGVFAAASSAPKLQLREPGRAEAIGLSSPKETEVKLRYRFPKGKSPSEAAQPQAATSSSSAGVVVPQDDGARVLQRPICSVCKRAIAYEAATRCKQCAQLRHIRCSYGCEADNKD